MPKTFTLDLGTASIGFSLRDTENGNTFVDQLTNFGSVIFKTTVNKDGKGNYKSLATNRREKRSPRRLYQARKYRIWETLKVLIDPVNKNKKDEEIDLDKAGIYCPLTMRELNRWRKYDKANGLKRQYPVDVLNFEQWVRLDFDGNEIADYSSPYQLRAELATTQLDFSLEINRYKLGRALYHIAQRRGFKSSKGETLKEQEEAIKESADTTVDLENVSLKKSEEKKSKDLITYMIESKLPTIGCAFAKLENEKVDLAGNPVPRIRASIYQAIRSQYKEEIKYIFDFQNGLDINSSFFNGIYSDRKDGSIFYKRPLHSQKSSVGKCTLEIKTINKNGKEITIGKPRCPISHPEFEKFRAFSFINNIQYRKTTIDEWGNLTPEQKLKLYKEKFLLAKPNFKFEEIRKWIEKEIGKPLSKEQKVADSTINYSDKTNVSGCPISGRLKNLLGDNWEKFVYETSEKRNDKYGKEHIITYSSEDIWHICFSFDDEEAVAEFAKTKLKFDDKKAKDLVNLWVAIPQGYSMLSLKAIRNINQFLVPKIDNKLYKGFIYTESALLGKLPEIMGDELWKENENEILESISDWIDTNREEKRILNIANSLIANYKSLEYNEELGFDEQFARKNPEYKLMNSDFREVEQYTIEAFGNETWNKIDDKEFILGQVAEKYQTFFAHNDKERIFYKLPKLGDTLKLYLSNNFPLLQCENQQIDPETKLPCQCPACKKLNKLYHPSILEFYKPAKEQEFEYDGILLSRKLLESPVIGAFKNPMAMRTLHELRKLVNYFIKEGIIDEETRIVVETARDLNDANMRWAIEAYQREREEENKEFESAIQELKNSNREVNNDDIDKARLLVEQIGETQDQEIFELKKIIRDIYKKKKERTEAQKKLLQKYRLWLEQGMQCIYTGKIININNLFDENLTDFEHTIPRSLSFDNSLANLTICDSYYNRQVKKNRIPTQLENYDENATINGQVYSAIKPRLEKWEQKVEQLRNNVEFWVQKSKQAQPGDTKDYAIRQKHLWKMELDYWQDKLARFTMTEVTKGFKHSQLNDTRLITKYAYHYLKSVFSKVEVQKGSVTADFRKMLGVQSVDEKKSRDKHSHHAIDAAILSLIPVAAKRDKMLELFYKIQEEKKLNRNTEDLEQALQKEIRTCQIGKVSNLAQNIEENILINHISNDQTLTPAKRKKRQGGKVVWLRDENGIIIRDVNGKGISKYLVKGDSIRGQLHKDTFYGKIRLVLRDVNGKPLRNKNGSWKFQTDKDEFAFVKRIPIADLTSLEQILNPELKNNIQNQLNGRTLSKAIEDGLFMFDKRGRKVNKIRHIRIKTSISNPISVKKHIYLSTKEYKQDFYAENAENTLYALYWDGKNDLKGFDCRNLFDVAIILRTTNSKVIEDFFEPEKLIGRGNNKILVPLYTVLKPGTKVIFYEKSKEELKTLSNTELSPRIYKMNRIFSSEDGRIQFYHHLDARDDKQLLKDFPEKAIWFDGKPIGKRQKNGVAKFTTRFIAPRLLIAPSNFNFIVEEKDFEMKLDGMIRFKF
nr:CRISPR-associated protein Cas9 [uncultured bacterium]